MRETVTAFLKHRPLYIPGRLMRIMTRLMPRSLSIRMNGRLLGQAARNLADQRVSAAGCRVVTTSPVATVVTLASERGNDAGE